ncbi:hypothetical protein LSCM1_07931 [Leishmania martiniquensis]|uniref:PH-like domain-containing protein n=1 Tax=Leishmania martiniquensis TaxID=1580590 RepID=A0A836HSB0_9TRYP|nr:hypothetical protein LSCM1_07931 [Leishmania martiniquensis]
MAPRNGLRVKVVSPNSGTATMSRSVSVASSAYSSGHTTLGTTLLRSGLRRRESQQGSEEMADGGRPAATCVPLQSRRAPLRTMSVNMLHEAGSAHDKKAPCGRAPLSACTTADGSGDSVGKGARTCRSLPNFFEGAEFTSGSGTQRRGRLPQLSTSRSRSGPCYTDVSALEQRQQPPSQRRAEDEEAVRRAAAALELAGGTVLRRPFGGGIATSDRSHTTTSALGAKTSSLSSQERQRQPERRGLRLPPTIPITAHTRCRRSEDSDYSGNHSSMGSTVSSYKRARSWAEPPPPPSALAVSQQPTSASRPLLHGTPPVAESSAQRVAVPLVCPGMFTGLSAIHVDEKLFADANALYTSATSNPFAAPSASTATTAAEAGGGGVQQQRYCVRPLWSLVGTFKTSLSGLVAVDFNQECLRWSQRNPKGGQQTIKVPLASVLDVFTTRVVQEDDYIEERQFTVVARTSTRPSQVVFGFATASEANHLRNVLKRR